MGYELVRWKYFKMHFYRPKIVYLIVINTKIKILNSYENSK